MSSYDNSGPQWIRQRTLVEKWVASWAPSEPQIRANWIAEATKQQQRAQDRLAVMALRRRSDEDSWFTVKSQVAKDSHIDRMYEEKKKEKAEEQE